MWLRSHLYTPPLHQTKNSMPAARFIFLAGVWLMPIACFAEDSDYTAGAQLFAEKCASCHGAKGEGTSNVPQPLFGDRSAYDLAEVIATTMPDGEPEECIGEDAAAVASWMLKEFYSPAAQARINPPRKSLNRLTVAQYRNAVADLVEGFTWKNEPNDKSGLEATYFKSRHLRDKAFDRLDPQIHFDFGEGAPQEKTFEKKEEFSIAWEGSILIDETGWYDFVLQTENGVRLHVNDRETPLIDAWVKSGDGTEFRGSRFLLAGRLYPIRLEWFKFREKTASINLLWKPPHREDQLIPSRHLSPQNSPNVLVVETPFPPDDRSDGYIRGTSVSAEWDEATTYAAIEVADKLTPFLREMAGLKKQDSDDKRRSKIQALCEKLAFHAFRRPLTDELKRAYISNHFIETNVTPDALRRSVLAILKSPRFLYREIGPDDDLYTRAERLSFALMDSIPHPGLLIAAEKGWIKDEGGLRDQAWKLVNSYRGQVRLQEFLRVWLNLDRLHEPNKDTELFADFDSAVFSDMRTSLEMTLHEVSQSDDGFKTLIQGREAWINGRLADFLSVDQIRRESLNFQKVPFEKDHRAGVSSHPFMMTALAYSRTSSPIHRGVFLSRGLLGRSLKPPPDSVSPAAPDLEPHLNTRERVTKQTSPEMCFNCHKMINALGFPLERFDAVGRFREKEQGRPIDTSGGYRLATGQLVKFDGAVELADFLMQSPETHRSFSRQLFHHLVQQPILAYGSNTIDELSKYFRDSNFGMKQLMVEIAIRSARPGSATLKQNE